MITWRDLDHTKGAVREEIAKCGRNPSWAWNTKNPAIWDVVRNVAFRIDERLGVDVMEAIREVSWACDQSRPADTPP